ncbi:MAG: hypothetical protein QM656_10435 [Paracoccaceae bacterium]
MTQAIRSLPAVLMLLALGACVTTQPDEPVKIVRADSTTVVLRGLIDASRTEPPPRYAAIAQAQCARFARTAAFAAMEQRTTFGFDVTYHCVKPA